MRSLTEMNVVQEGEIESYLSDNLDRLGKAVAKVGLTDQT